MPSLFVLGGARSGKSRYAQQRAEATGLSPLYIATAQAWDDEMRDRIRLHQDERGHAWSTIEVPLALAEAIRRHDTPDVALLVDCLTLWVTNLLLSDHDIEAATASLTNAVASARGHVILVSNEVGLGIVPENALARRFRDEAGKVNQRVAAAASEVQFIAAGLNIRIK
ncbi:bifunctional adenosylcobinamide kinase/adenosylcobinamide-phosphate guanylyltransferase [Novosphingobium sp. NPDC080210]|uniref:bifunctional adenosylcobinamide kinase/adenosylcobinamide-phosphate guanylyltransferase n=1 Tax=Novosphingobium sp. NPDC080210 TaxID=3390596 RepID=UPI003CFE0C01